MLVLCHSAHVPMICFANVAIFIDMEVGLLIKIDGEGIIWEVFCFMMVFYYVFGADYWFMYCFMMHVASYECSNKFRRFLAMAECKQAYSAHLA